MNQAIAFARQQPVVYVDETGAPTGNADGGNPDGKRGWQWVMVTAMVTVFMQGLSQGSLEVMQSSAPELVLASPAPPVTP
jgi:transposase